MAVLLRGEAAAHISELRREIERRLHRANQHLVTPPHLTLAVIRNRPPPEGLRAVLSSVAAATAPFAVTGAGYGIFVGHGAETPIVHLALTRTPSLSGLHQAVFERLAATGAQVDGLCDPEHWRPHVTLSDTDLDATDVGHIAALLVAHRPRHWTFEIDNVALLTGDAGTIVEPLSGSGGCSG